jgi:hypothetical protein
MGRRGRGRERRKGWRARVRWGRIVRLGFKSGVVVVLEISFSCFFLLLKTVLDCIIALLQSLFLYLSSLKVV